MDNVLRFPGDWFGPDEPLVPFGPRADRDLRGPATSDPTSAGTATLRVSPRAPTMVVRGEGMRGRGAPAESDTEHGAAKRLGSPVNRLHLPPRPRGLHSLEGPGAPEGEIILGADAFWGEEAESLHQPIRQPDEAVRVTLPVQSSEAAPGPPALGAGEGDTLVSRARGLAAGVLCVAAAVIGILTIGVDAGPSSGHRRPQAADPGLNLSDMAASGRAQSWPVNVPRRRDLVATRRRVGAVRRGAGERRRTGATRSGIRRHPAAVAHGGDHARVGVRGRSASASEGSGPVKVGGTGVIDAPSGGSTAAPEVTPAAVVRRNPSPTSAPAGGSGSAGSPGGQGGATKSLCDGLNQLGCQGAGS